MRETLKKQGFFLFLLLMAVFLSVVRNPFILHIFIMIFTSASLGLAWNIIGGYGGQLSIGHTAFYGIGAYTSTLLYTHFGLSPWLGMGIGGLLAAVAAVLIGIPCFRLRGTYFALATMAFAEILRILCVYFKELTGGSMGIAIQFKAGFWNFMFKGKEPYAYVALVLLGLMYYLSLAVERSRLGYFLVALKEDEDGAKALGINTYSIKMLAFMISAFLTSLIGSFFAQYILFVEPEGEFSLILSIFITLPVMIGGIGTTIGPVLGAFIITPLQEFLRFLIGGQYQGLQSIFFGVILIVVVLCIPQGILKWVHGKLIAPRKAPRL